jgi:hypothetical protein
VLASSGRAQLRRACAGKIRGARPRHETWVQFRCVKIKTGSKAANHRLRRALRLRSLSLSRAHTRITATVLLITSKTVTCAPSSWSRWKFLSFPGNFRESPFRENRRAENHPLCIFLITKSILFYKLILKIDHFLIS